MQLQTSIPLSPAEQQIDYRSKVLLLGSCFTENIGGKLNYFKFQNIQNPFGIVFHPLAIETLVERAAKNTPFTIHDVFKRDGQWLSFEAHSSVTALSQENLVTLLNKRLQAFSMYLSEASHIVITFGTAWAYRYLSDGKFVANCHKIPQSQFKKELLGIEQISESLSNIVGLIAKRNPRATVITTVSPVRHLKDGFVENTCSKAHLISALHQANQSNLTYFPSYEIMMDELRDYRFYTSDMLHPNQTAVDYIWEKFSAVWVDPATASLQKEIEAIQKGLQHRPFHSESDQHQEFLETLRQRIKRLKEQLPHVSF